VQTLKSLASIADDSDAIQYLNEHNWDLEKAAEAVLSAKSGDDDDGLILAGSEKISYQEGNSGRNSKVLSSNDALLLVTMPDSRVNTFPMKGTDTFWGLYGQLVRAEPDLTRKNFTFVLPNGHKLQEHEFNQNFQACGCVPEAKIQVVFLQ